MENKQQKTALLQKWQTKSVAPSAALVQESLFGSRVCRQRGSWTTSHGRNAKLWVSATLTQSRGVPRGSPGGCTQKVHRATRRSPHVWQEVGSWQGQRGLQDCAPCPPAAGWGEVLMPTHRWTVLFEGGCQEQDREQWNSHLAFERAGMGGSWKRLG